MNEIQVSLKAVMPLFFMMLIGYSGKKGGMFQKSTVDELNAFSYKYLFPTLVFYNIYSGDFSGQIPLKLIGFAIVSLLCFLAAMIAFYQATEKEVYRKGVLVQGSVRSNFVLFAVPIVTALYGEGGLGNLPVMIAFLIPVLNVISVVSLEFFRKEGIDFAKIVKGILSNTMIRASIFAVMLVIFEIRFPAFLEKTISDLSKATTPLALIMLGATFDFSSLKKDRRFLAEGVFCKLVLFPLLFLPAAVLCGFRNVDLVGLLVLFGAPDAVSSYSLAVQMDSDGSLAAELIVVTSVLSVFTIFLWIVLLKRMCLI